MNDVTVTQAIPVVIMTVLGVVAPFIIQLGTRLITNERVRFLVSLALSGLTGLVAMLVAKIPLSASPEALGLWYAWTSFLFKMVWKPLWKKNGSILNAPATTYK
jgi:hypothetical protein